jgi:multicomponent Na+:H+ antiporter subunit B
MTDSAQKQPAPDVRRAESDAKRRAVAGVLAAGVFAALVTGFSGLPRETAHLPSVALRALRIALPQWGTTEPVNEIVYGSRGWDTFGETFLLLAAVVAVITLARPREPRTEYVGEASAGLDEQRMIDPQVGVDAGEEQARYAEEEEEDDPLSPPDPDEAPLGEEGPERSEGMTVIVRVAARTAAVILAVAAVYLAAWGFTPGGGFPAGAALTGVVLILYTALGRRRVERAVSQELLEPVEIGGALAIILIGILGLVFKDSLFANWVLLAQPQQIRSGGDQQLYSAAELVEVATGLIIAIFALLRMTHGWTPDAPGDDDAGGKGGGK